MLVSLHCVVRNKIPRSENNALTLKIPKVPGIHKNND